jgi:hypothetical protein
MEVGFLVSTFGYLYLMPLIIVISLNLCLAGLFLPVYLFLIPSIKPIGGQSFTHKLKNLDFGNLRI